MRDNKFDCENRADEEPFATGFGDSSSLLLDLDNILTPCKYGFKCSGNCLPLVGWCNQQSPHTCDELAGKTATGKTIDLQMCSNETYWERVRKGCSVGVYGILSCTGESVSATGDSVSAAEIKTSLS